MSEIEKLDTLAARRNEEHRAFVKTFRKTVEHAVEHGIRAGELPHKQRRSVHTALG